LHDVLSSARSFSHWLERSWDMASLEDQFAKAQQQVHALPQRLDNDTLLQLYALYKQATQGDASGDPPGGFDFVKRAKYDAWSKLKGTSPEEAMRQYVKLAAALRG
jgi:diazepam-binding inhibitor (GABA receptor modulator, acyl-CoA-binding protein)